MTAAQTPPPLPQSDSIQSSVNATTRRTHPLVAWTRVGTGEVFAILAVTGRFLMLAFQSIVALLIRAMRRRSAELARRKFGERCRTTVPGDNPLARSIADLDRTIAELHEGKKSTRRLEADRRRLLVQLADEASAAGATDETFRQWATARQRVTESDQRIRELYERLKPQCGRHLLRLSTGFAAVLVVGMLIWGGRNQAEEAPPQLAQAPAVTGATSPHRAADPVPVLAPRPHRTDAPAQDLSVPREVFGGPQPAVTFDTAQNPSAPTVPEPVHPPAPAIQPRGTTLPPPTPTNEVQPTPQPVATINYSTYRAPRLTYLEFVQNKLVEAHGAAQAAAQNKRNLSSMIASARTEFWNLYPNGAGVEEARDRFARLLWQKDFFYWMTYIVEGRQGVTAKIVDPLTGGAIDGGIAPFAKEEFFSWVDQCRLTMGARSDKDLVLVTPNGIIKALMENKASYEAYIANRDLIEFFESSKSPLLLTDPKQYLIAAFTRDRWANSMEVGAKEYEALDKFWGVDRTLAIAKLIQAQPKQADRFTFAHPKALDWPYEPPKSQPDAVDYVEVQVLKEAMTTSDPRMFVLALSAWRGSPANAQQELERLEKEYGHDRVLQLCKQGLEKRDPEDWYGRDNLTLEKLAKSLQAGARDQDVLAIISNRLGDADAQRTFAALEAEYGREILHNAQAQLAREAEFARAHQETLPGYDRFLKLLRARVGFQLVHDNDSASFGSSRLDCLGVTVDGKLWGDGGNLFGMHADGNGARILVHLQNRSPICKVAYSAGGRGDRYVVIDSADHQDETFEILRLGENLELKSMKVSESECEGRVHSVLFTDRTGALYGLFKQDFRGRKKQPPPELRLFRWDPSSNRLQLLGEKLPELYHTYNFVDGGDGWFYGIRMDHSARGRRENTSLCKIRRDGTGYLELHALNRFLSLDDGEPSLLGSQANRVLLHSDGAVFGLLSSDDSGVLESEVGGRAEGELFRYDTVKNEYSVLHNFGRYMYATALIEGPQGKLYGVMRDGFSRGRSALFCIDKSGRDYRVLDVDFAPHVISLTSDQDALYGTIDGRFRNSKVNGVFRFGLIPPVEGN